MQPREVFGPTVPAWIKRRIKRWKKVFNLNDWVVRAFVSNSQVIVTVNNGDEAEVDAHTTTNSPYRYANMHVAEHVKDNDEGHAIVFHEMRHIVYASQLTDWITRDVINRYVPEGERKFVGKQLDDAIEGLIENDVYVFEQLTDL